MHSSRGRLRNVEYSILLVMSELSIVRCDHALGLWIAGTQASSVDGELPWRSSGWAAAVASTPGSRARAATEGGFLCFPSTSSMTASSITSVFEESCFGF